MTREKYESRFAARKEPMAAPLYNRSYRTGREFYPQPATPRFCRTIYSPKGEETFRVTETIPRFTGSSKIPKTWRRTVAFVTAPSRFVEKLLSTSNDKRLWGACVLHLFHKPQSFGLDTYLACLRVAGQVFRG